MTVTAPLPGFSDLALQSQAAFRALLDAMAHPGRVLAAPEPVDAPAPLSATAAMVALTLCDNETSLWIDAPLADSREVRQFLAFHTGAPITTDRAKARFALVSDPAALDHFDGFPFGLDTYPDRSTTVIFQVDDLRTESGVTLTGPGIETEQKFSAAPLPPAFWDKAQANRALFPRGLDFLFCGPDAIAALPRSTKIAQEG